LAALGSESESYDHLDIEARWQRYWDEHGTFRAARRSGRLKRYVLDMFPYPSGVGLHVYAPFRRSAPSRVAKAAEQAIPDTSLTPFARPSDTS
jgi:hypothetical protein